MVNADPGCSRYGHVMLLCNKLLKALSIFLGDKRADEHHKSCPWEAVQN